VCEEVRINQTAHMVTKAVYPKANWDLSAPSTVDRFYLTLGYERGGHILLSQNLALQVVKWWQCILHRL